MSYAQHGKWVSSDQRPGASLLLLLLVLPLGLCLAACGDDGSGGGGGAGGGEPECQSGFTETGCMCTSGGLGSRMCVDGMWSQCSCPPPLGPGECRPGTLVLCSPCQDGGEQRRMDCPADGIVDCGCPAAGGDAGNAGNTTGAGDEDAG
ncbi:MAG: hypothetical protein OEZ06_02165 [Myxococcales bacterium]|nr:hypothetical protein [Myxococcales bacterium]